MATPTSVPDVLQRLCPGCGATDVDFPCPRCGTPAPSRIEPQPAERTASGVLFLGVALFTASGLCLAFVPSPYGPVGALILGAIGVGLTGLSVLAMRDPPRPWLLVAAEATGVGVVQGGQLLYAYGSRRLTEPVDPADHVDLIGLEPSSIRAALETLEPDPVRAARLHPDLVRLAQAARGETRVELATVIRWSDGHDQAPETRVEEVSGPDPAAVRLSPTATPVEDLRRWRARHEALWEALAHARP